VFRLFQRRKKRNRILAFQSRLLKELTLTSGSLRNGESPAKNIAAAAREVLDLCFLFTFHIGADDRYELHFFWCNSPSAASRATALRMIQDAVAADPSFAAADDFAVAHTAVDPAMIGDIDRAGLDLRTRLFSTDQPKSSGMVGLGLRKSSGISHEERIAVENILITLVSSASSVKTLATYTREIERFATRDPLTNLYNQIAFWDLLNYETERSKRQEYRFSLLAIDLDNFKAINDSYGHEAGDALLKELSVVVKTAVRAGDIVARYAGDQFMAVLPVCDEGQAYIVTRRILENVRDFTLTLPGSGMLKLTASIGVAVFPDHAQEARDLYLLAESMLIQAKTFGKDRLSMPSEHDNVRILKSMGEKNILILEALSRRKIVPYFQPIINMKDKNIEAYEVLTRIVMNDRVIPASEFIETAESMGAIGKIDYQLIELAFAKMNESRYRGKLFLNLSPKALIMQEFMPTVLRLLRDYNIDPSHMVFEITERDTVKGLDVMEKHMNKLKNEGFRFAIDDFGAGYSSFQYIRRFSIDYLKVDGEFVRNMNGSSAVENAIVSSIASLSEKLGIKTIAEFVETEDIFSEVRSAGIDYAQGFYIQRPSPDLL
jgi:diguanylate cyclase (GGDEF)-like protein